MAIVTTATSITPPFGAEELHAHMWQATASIADWVTSSQGCNELQVRNLIEYLQLGTWVELIAEKKDAFTDSQLR
jgi:hypothetical protein